MTIKTQEKKNVPIDHVNVFANMNARTDDDPAAVEALMQSIQETGLDHDITVIPDTNHDPDDRGGYFIVVAGFTRAKAINRLAQLGKWPADQLMTVTVLQATAAKDIYVRNLSENVVRRDLRSADLAKRLFELTEGLCSDPLSGGTVPKMSAQALADSLSKSVSFVRELIRAWRGSSEKVRKAWAAEEVATDQVRAWCTLSEEEQADKLAAFKRGERAAAKKAAETNGSGTHAEAEEGESEETETKPRKKKSDDDERKPPTKTEILEKVAKLAAKLDGGGLSKEEQTIARARWEALRWAAGEVRRLG
jgi:ParB-like chromosome segregation protein Spo0J